MTDNLGLPIRGNQEKAVVLQSMPPLEPYGNSSLLAIYDKYMYIYTFFMNDNACMQPAC